MITFENTENAFKYQSDKDLKRAYRLFKLVGKPWLVKVGKSLLPIALKLHLPIRGAIKASIFKQFCGGETIAECEKTIQKLHQYNVGTILDYSIEGQTEEDEFDSTQDEIIASIKKSKENDAIPFGVFKVTGLAPHYLLEKMNDVGTYLNSEDKAAFGKVLNRIDKICKFAHDNNVSILFDAEETWIQNTIDRLCESMMVKYNKNSCIIYNTIQMYRCDRLAYISKKIEDARIGNHYFGIKLVRGAYMEKERERSEKNGYPSPIQPNKVATDTDFNAAVTLILNNIDICYLCCGTHNEESTATLVQLMIDKKIDKADKHIYFAQLLGMSDHISFNLSYEGYNVAKYVPYAPLKKIIPYLLRRANENTSVAGQTSRELNLISTEWERRKALKH